jgi:membrane protein
MRRWGEFLRLMHSAGACWVADNAASMGAALAFYSAFALAPLLLILSAVAGLVYGQSAARQALLQQVNDLVGPIGSEAVGRLLDQMSQGRSSMTATLIGLVLLVVGASSVMVELQQDLDRIWRVPPHSPDRPWWALLRSRLASFALVVACGLVLLMSLLASTMINALVAHSAAFAPHSLLLHTLHLTITLIVFSLLFAVVFKWLPNVSLEWRDVWRGAFVTALLLTIGQLGIGYYLGHSTTTSAYAAAASLLVLLLWLYYASQILLFGAEFVWVYSQRRHTPPPEANRQRLDAAPVPR